MDAVKEHPTVRRINIAMAGADDVLHALERPDLVFQIVHFFTPRRCAERGDRRSLFSSHRQELPAFIYSITEGLIDERRDPCLDERPGGFEMVFGVPMIDDEGVDFALKLSRIFHDPWDAAFRGGVFGELIGLAPHPDHFTAGEFPITIEELAIADGVRIF